MTHAASPATRALMRRNLRLLPWWWVLRWVWLGEGIWVIYLTDERGLTLGQAVLFEALYACVVVVTEIPTGMVADRFGRRASVVIGSICVVLAFLAFGAGTSLVVLLIAYAFFGISETSYSGADTAMLYDSLKAVDREEDFTAAHGRLNALVAAGIAVFTVAGSLMVHWWPLWTPIILSAALSAPAILLAWFMTEPPREDERHAYIETGRRAVRLVLRSPNLLAVMLLMGVATVAIGAMATLQQHLLREAGVPVWAIGLFVASQLALAAVGSWVADPLGRWLTIRRTFLLMLPALSALALAAGAPGLVVLYPLFIFPALGWNVMFPHFTEYLARRVTDSLRATVISIGNVVGGLAALAIVPLTGLGVDRLGLRPALLLLAIVLLGLTAVAYLVWHRAGDLDREPRLASVDAPPGAAVR